MGGDECGAAGHEAFGAVPVVVGGFFVVVVAGTFYHWFVLVGGECISDVSFESLPFVAADAAVGMEVYGCGFVGGVSLLFVGE